MAVEDAARQRVLREDQRLLQYVLQRAGDLHRRHLHDASPSRRLRRPHLRRLPRVRHAAHSDEHLEGRHALPPRRPHGVRPHRRRRHHGPSPEVIDAVQQRSARGRSRSRTRSSDALFDIVGGASYNKNVVLRGRRREQRAHPRSFVATRTPRPTPGTAKAPPSWLQRTGTAHADVSAARDSRPPSTATAPASARARSIPTSMPERATNYEVGGSEAFRDGAGVGQRLLFGSQGQHSERLLRGQWHTHRRYQRRRRALRSRALGRLGRVATLRVGGNYTYIERDLDYRKRARASRSAPMRNGRAAAARWRQPSRGHAAPQGVRLRRLERDATVDLDAEPRAFERPHRPDHRLRDDADLGIECRVGRLRRYRQVRPARATELHDIGSYVLLNFRADYDGHRQRYRSPSASPTCSMRITRSPRAFPSRAAVLR